jgi:hypothetical protein
MSGRQILYSSLACLGTFYAVVIWALVVSIHNRIKRSRRSGLKPFEAWAKKMGEEFFSVLDE